VRCSWTSADEAVHPPSFNTIKRRRMDGFSGSCSDGQQRVPTRSSVTHLRRLLLSLLGRLLLGDWGSLLRLQIRIKQNTDRRDEQTVSKRSGTAAEPPASQPGPRSPSLTSSSSSSRASAESGSQLVLRYPPHSPLLQLHPQPFSTHASQSVCWAASFCADTADARHRGTSRDRANQTGAASERR
jgi:hypothetical protein